MAGGRGGNDINNARGGAGGTGYQGGAEGRGGDGEFIPSVPGGPKTGYGGGGGGGAGGGQGGAGGAGQGGEGRGGINPGDTGGNAQLGGGGGGGQHGIVTTALTNNGVSFLGGDGGDGSNRFGGGGGGAGGYGAVVTGTGTSNNVGTITGGTGGIGASANDGGDGGSGGDGGVGVQFTMPSVLDNAGTITGGNGGVARPVFSGGTVGTVGLGGAGVVGANLSVTNTASITGGTGRNGQADAIDFTGGNNGLTLSQGGIVGTLGGGIGVGGTLTINPGTTVGVNVTLTNQIHDYTNPDAGTNTAGSVVKVGVGTLSLTSANTYTGGTFVEGGSVVAGAVGAFGSGTVHLVDPTVVFAVTGAQTNVFSLDVADPAADPSVFQVNAGITATLSGGIVTGTGSNSLGQAIAADQPLVVTGPGSLVLTNTGSYTGGTTITGGATVSASHNATNAFLDAVGSGPVTLDNGTLAFGVGTNVANAIGVTANGGRLDAGTVTNNNVILRSGLTGTGPLTLAGTTPAPGSTGRLVLQADDSGLTGPVTIARGAVGASVANALSPNAALTVNAGASLDLNAQAGATSQTVGALAGGGAITASDPFNGGTPTAVSLTAGGNNTSTAFSGTLANGQGAALGLIKTGTGTLALTGAANTYTGGTTIQAGTLDLGAAGAAGTGAIGFASTSGSATAQLVLEQSAQAVGSTFANTLDNFGANEALVLRNFAFTGPASYTLANNTLSITGGTGGTQTQSFRLSNTTETTYFAREDGQGGTIISANLVCYVTGTRIRVWRESGAVDVAVEDLVVGDRALTASGAAKAIAWIGSRTEVCDRYADARQVWPIRLRQGALGAGLPVRDLLVSPDHAIAIGPEHGLATGETGGGSPVLVPAFALLNGATVVRAPMAQVTYWHVELEGSHDLLLAEGLAAESYLDCGNRDFFAGADLARDPGLDAPASCLPRTNDADRLAPVRARMRAHALALGWRLEASDPLGGLRLIADGTAIAPVADGLKLRFLVPAETREVWLVSGSSVPWEVSGAGDARRLGACISGLSIDDGLTPRRVIGLDDPTLQDGFHPAEAHGAGVLRWTAGRARLPAELWTGCREVFFLRVDLACACLPAWQAPAAILSIAAETGGHLRALRSYP